MSSPASSWSLIATRVASWNASECDVSLNASRMSLPASWCVNHAGRGYDPTVVVGSSMRRRYHSSPRDARSRARRRRAVVRRPPGRAARHHARGPDAVVHRASGRRARHVALGARSAIDAAWRRRAALDVAQLSGGAADITRLSLIHISEPTRLLSISYAVFCL